MKTAQSMEIESIKKTQTEGNLETKYLPTQAGTAEVSLRTERKRWKRDSLALKTHRRHHICLSLTCLELPQDTY